MTQSSTNQQMNKSNDFFLSLKDFMSILPQYSEHMFNTTNCTQSPSISKKERLRLKRAEFSKSRKGQVLWGPTHSADSMDTSYLKVASREDTDENGATSGSSEEDGYQRVKSTRIYQNGTSTNTASTSDLLFSLWKKTATCVHDWIDNNYDNHVCKSKSSNNQSDSPLDKSHDDSLIDDDTPCNSPTKVTSPANYNGKTAGKNHTGVYKTNTNQYFDSLSQPPPITLSSTKTKSGFNKSEVTYPHSPSTRASRTTRAIITQDVNPFSVPTAEAHQINPASQGMMKQGITTIGKRTKSNVAIVNKNIPPLTHIAIDLSQSLSLQKSVSELTMRSCLAAISQPSCSRRMAYYAVNKNSSNNTSGSNRRCYFSDLDIQKGYPFYAGIVQEGTKSLVVFCQPTIFPQDFLRQLKEEEEEINIELMARCDFRKPANTTHKSKSSTILDTLRKKSTLFQNTQWKDSHGQVTIPPQKLFEIMPHPNRKLLQRIEKLYPNQFLTLPQSLRFAASWKVYCKFCFFSGLPIADGDLYYRVLDSVEHKWKVRDDNGDENTQSNSNNKNNNYYKKKNKKSGISSKTTTIVDDEEEIILSHEIMVAVNGRESADILRLPNLKTFSYLRENYSSQCAKLNSVIFDRSCWEMVLPEV